LASLRSAALVAGLTTMLLVDAGVCAAAPRGDAAVQRGIERLVVSRGGPPGAIVTLYRDGRLTVLRAGRSDVRRRGAPRASDHMRLGSVTKAFSGAVALRLVQEGKLGLDDTIAERAPGLPAAWGGVTVRQLLNHTSGLPNFTTSQGFVDDTGADPQGFVSPMHVIDWVRDDPLVFAPGSSYAYSNTDNIVVGLIAEAVSGQSYARLLSQTVFGPAGLRATSFPSVVTLPRPFLHGYDVAPGKKPEDLSTAVSPSWAWASGAAVSTPAELNLFVRDYLGRRFFGAAQQRQQLRFVPGGASSPPGPGRNAAGLAIFRYQTRCGTVYGHTGDFFGYAQFAAATADGKRALTTSLNISAPQGGLLRRLRTVQTTAVCALLAPK